LGEDDEPINTSDKTTSKLIMKGSVIGDNTIYDPQNAEGSSLSNLVPIGNTPSVKLSQCKNFSSLLPQNSSLRCSSFSDSSEEGTQQLPFEHRKSMLTARKKD